MLLFRKHFFLALSFSLCLSWVIATPHVYAQSEAPYYQGKTIRILVSSPAGGGTDAAARLVSRFIAKYIPGNPKIAVQNMPGGSGTIANNYFANEVKPDGLTILQDSSAGVMNFIRGGATVKYDPRKFKIIGGVARPGSILMIRKEARARLMDRKAKPAVVGDTDGIRTWVAMTVWGAEYLGWNLRWIYGYPGSRELQLALRQGEIDVWATSNSKLIKDLQREGVVELLVMEDNERRKDFGDVPTFLEALGEKKPTGLSWRAYQAWAGSPDLDKFLVAPEGTPDHLVKTLREAFNQVMKDPEVDKEGDKFFGDDWKPHGAEKIEAVIREHIDVPKEATDFVTKMRQKYGLPLGEKQS